MSAKKKRLEKVEGRLTPTQAAVLWMEEAHRFPSVLAYLKSLDGKPDSVYPLYRLPDQVEAATREAMKGRPREDVDRAVRQAVRDVVFLFHLHQQANAKVMSELETWPYRLRWLGGRFRDLLGRLAASQDIALACLRLTSELPYPLDADTAAAVDAAKRHAIITWQALEDMETVAEWVTAQYVAEGRTELPPWSSLVRPGEPPPRFVVAPTEEDVRAAFADEKAFDAFMAGNDYSYGLADVPDREYERRCDEVEAGLRALAESGAVAQGLVVRLETAPHLFLQEAPLVDGVWLDGHVVELAEWGALLEQHGFVRREDDDHPLALPRFMKASEAGPTAAGPEELRALRERARRNLSRFRGRTRELDGRLYLHFEDYVRWRGRRVKGDPAALVESGFTLSSWNAWVEAQGEAEVAGVRVGEIHCWADGAPYDVCEDAAERQEARWQMLERLRAWTVHDPDAGTLWARTSPFDRRPFAEELDAWKLALEEALREVAEMRLALASISRRYFDGHEVLFGANADAIRAIADALVSLAELYNRWPGADRERLHHALISQDAQPGDFLIEASLDNKAGGTSLVRYLVDMAKAEAVDMMGDRREALALARRHLGFAG